MREHDTICELVSYPARSCHTIENEPPCEGACKKTQRFNRYEGCPTAEEATGRVREVNPIGRSRPDRQESTRSEGVDSSRSGAHLAPTRVFTHPTANKRLATPRHIGRAGPQTGPTGRCRIGEGSDACGRCCSAHGNLRGRGHSRQPGAAGGRAPEGSESQGVLRNTAARESRSPGLAGNLSFRTSNTGGAMSNTRPHMRAPRPADAGRGLLTHRGVKV